MALHDSIQEEVRRAMKAGDKVRLSVVRGIVSALTNELVSKRRKPNETLADDEVLAVISRLARERKDSIQQFRSGNREDLAADEEAELVILREYIPAEMNESEIRTAVTSKKAELGITDKAKLGMLLGAIMKDLRGRADGALVKKIAEESFGQ
ncbi:MAG: GatB/YqeY domain-containing protein [Candidatus Vogelbacteria bacterium]|nr:GatB/YqeY domain-containing protein [Candidatus Vogelbacteria bacterium]